MSDPDTGAGTPLTAEERSALSSVLTVVRAAATSEFAPFMDGDPVDAFLGALTVVDPPLTVRPATDPAGLEAKAEVMRGWAADPSLKPATPWLSLSVALAILEGRHPALVARLSVADGPGPEERPDE